MNNWLQDIFHLMAKAFLESVHAGTWLGEGNERNWLPLRWSSGSGRLTFTDVYRERHRASLNEEAETSFWDFWKCMTRSSLLPRASQIESWSPPGCPNQWLWLLPWLGVSKGALVSQFSTAYSPHGTQWKGWLSAVTSVKTQPSSGNSLYFVLLLESNYHLVASGSAILLCQQTHNAALWWAS